MVRILDFFTTPTFQVFLGGLIFVFGRAVALVLIFKIGNGSLNFGEALDLAGITLVLAPVVLFAH